MANIRKGGLHEERAMSELFKSFHVFVAMGQSRYKLNESQSLQAYSDSLLSFRRQVIQEKFRGESQIKTYLFKIFSNKCIDILRKRPSKEVEGLESAVEISNESDNVMKRIIIAEEMEALMKEFEKLGESCKQILLLAEYLGYTSAEIADKIGFKNAHSVISKKHKCLQRLRGNLKKKDVKGSENV
ncbi:MAG: sigma-70 family RNA polymerase sigma factor [Bacteroidota bacterium]